MFKIYEFVDLKDKKLQDNKNLKLLLFVEVHAQSVPHVPAGYNCRITFSLVITVGNTFPPLITLEHVPACYNCREYIPACYNCRNTFPLVITVRNRFLLVITVENTFPLVITVGSFFVADLKCHLWVAKNVAHLKCHVWFTVICMDYDLDFCLKQRKLKEEVVKLRVFLFF